MKFFCSILPCNTELTCSMQLIGNYLIIWKNSYIILVTTRYQIHSFSGVMDRMLALSAADCGFKPQSGRTKDNEIGICRFSAKHAALRKRKNWLGRNQDNVSEWGDIVYLWTCFSELAL